MRSTAPQMTMTPSSPPRRSLSLPRFAPIALILLLALILRLIALDSRALWYDEAFAVLFSEKGLNAMLYGTLAPADGAAADVHPLLYYTTLDGWMRLFGQSPTAVRLYSVLLGLLTIYVLYRLGAELFSESSGLAAALITAIAPYHVQYSQETRMYALLGLVLMGATWCFVRGWRSAQSGQWRYWIGFGVLAGVAMYTQQLAAFYLAALGLVPLLARRRDMLIRVAVGAGIALILYAPWLINLPAQFGKLSAYWISKPQVAQLLLTLWSFIAADLPLTLPPAMILTMIAFVLILVLLMLRVYVMVRRRRADLKPLMLVLWLVAAPMLLMWLLSQWRPVYLNRALLPSGLMFYLALGWLVTRAKLPRFMISIAAVVWLLAAALVLFLHYTWDVFPRPPFDRALARIQLDWQDGDRIVHANKITMLPMIYYARRLPQPLPQAAQAYIRDVPGFGSDTLALPTQEVLGLLADPCVAVAAKGSPRVWFVIFEQQMDEEGGDPVALRWLRQHYRLHEDQSLYVNEMRVYFFDQPDETARTARCETTP